MAALIAVARTVAERYLTSPARPDPQVLADCELRPRHELNDNHRHSHGKTRIVCHVFPRNRCDLKPEPLRIVPLKSTSAAPLGQREEGVEMESLLNVKVFPLSHVRVYGPFPSEAPLPPVIRRRSQPETSTGLAAVTCDAAVHAIGRILGLAAPAAVVWDKPVNPRPDRTTKPTTAIRNH
jgi:hypothetical protein